MNFQLLFMKRGLFQFTIPDLLKASKDKNSTLQHKNGEYCRLKAILINFQYMRTELNI